MSVKVTTCFLKRWLERELGRGNSRLRAQGEGELKKLEDSSYPRQRDRTAWQRFQLLECVNYFLSSGTAATLVTADLEILSGEAELPTLEGDWQDEELDNKDRGEDLVDQVRYDSGKNYTEQNCN